eukprot:7262428-Heterocapsa_arctica.AAC.1
MKPLRNTSPKKKDKLGKSTTAEDKSDGSAITTELRTQQNKMSRMKNTTLVRKGAETRKKG